MNLGILFIILLIVCTAIFSYTKHLKPSHGGTEGYFHANLRKPINVFFGLGALVVFVVMIIKA